MIAMITAKAPLQLHLCRSNLCTLQPFSWRTGILNSWKRLRKPRPRLRTIQINVLYSKRRTRLFGQPQKNVSNVNLHGKNILKCFKCPEECLTICLTLLAICQRMQVMCQNKLDAYAPHHHKTKDVDAAEQVMLRAIRRLVDTWSYRFLCWGTLT